MLSPNFAVIPTFLLAGPAVLVAALCPVLFAALAAFGKRWRILLGVLSVTSSLYLAQAWFGGYLEGAWWGSRQAIWSCLAAVAGLGAFWSFWLARKGQIRQPDCWAESLLIAALGVSCCAVSLVGRTAADARVLWTFAAVDPGLILSTPWVDGDRVYVSAAHATVLGPFGAVYCLDRATGKTIWQFNRDGRMKQAFSSPTVYSGRLYVGEGLHEDTDCGLYCLDAGTGRELWRYAVKSHVESSPRVAHGCVYFGAGEDGVICLDAETGALRWRFPGLHVDATPAIAGNRLYAGSVYGNPEVFCLDALTGQPVWRIPCDLSPLGSPAVSSDQVYFGLGNGKLNRSDPNPAGALLCLDTSTGNQQWRHDVPDGVLSSAALTDEFVYFGSRDRHCYCLDRRSGQRRWKKDLGSPVVAGPRLSGGRLYAVGSSGMIFCFDARRGSTHWHFEIARLSHATPEMVSQPAFATEADGERLYLGMGLHDPISFAATVYCVSSPVSQEE